MDKNGWHCDKHHSGTGMWLCDAQKRFPTASFHLSTSDESEVVADQRLLKLMNEKDGLYG